MKKMILLFGFLFVVSMTWAQEGTKETKKKDLIVFDSLTYNYGKIAKGSPGECVFKFVNKSKKPLILTNVKASCGCTTPSWPKEAIKPRKKGEIAVKYNTNNVGYFTKTITVNTNLQEAPIILTIMGQVIEQ